MDIDISELNSLSASLSRVDAKLMPLARVAVRKIAADVTRDAKIFAPVDTGNLRNSVGASFTGNAHFAAAEIGATANYASYVELGTSRTAPQAFLGPALDRNGHAFVSAIAALADKAIHL